MFVFVLIALFAVLLGVASQLGWSVDSRERASRTLPDVGGRVCDPLA